MCASANHVIFFTMAGGTHSASKIPTVVVFVVIIHLLVRKPSPCIQDVAAARFVTNPFGAAATLTRAKRC